jgi:hypothetical protein
MTRSEPRRVLNLEAACNGFSLVLWIEGLGIGSCAYEVMWAYGASPTLRLDQQSDEADKQRTTEEHGPVPKV